MGRLLILMDGTEEESECDTVLRYFSCIYLQRYKKGKPVCVIRHHAFKLCG
jgi:hypothetical protein